MCLLRGEVVRMNFPGDDGNVEDGDGGNKSDESEEYFPEDSWPI
jgi:hypothetical protein